MAKYGSDDFGITVDANEMKNFIDTLSGIDIEALLQEGHAFGDAWVEQLASGISQGTPLEVAGFYDDVALGPDAIFNAIGTTVAVIITWGGSKTTTFSAVIQTFRRLPTRGETTRYSCTLLPTGAITEA